MILQVRKYIGLLLFCVCSLQQINAQVDTTFWFAAPWVTPDHDQNTPMAFHFSTFGNATTIRLRQPASVYDTTFTVPANSLFSKYVSHIVDSLESKPADTVLNSGFEITSNYPIVCVYDFISEPPNSNNPETYSLKGNNGLGFEFVTPFQTLWNNRTLTNDRNGDGIITQPKQMFCVVASEDSTTIFITPRCNVVGGHPANSTYSVLLPKAGNVYTCENAVLNTSAAGNNMAGSIVVADKPVSVTVSDDSVNPSGGGGCFDLMGDQIVPTDVIGLDYIINKGFLNAGSNESVFVLATENFTTITIDDGTGTTSAILNKGDTYQYSITEQLTYVQSDKNTYVLHMSGYGCELGQAILPPLNCAGSDQVSFPRTNAVSFLLNVLCPAGAEGNFTVNGDPNIVQATDFLPVPGTGGAWMGAQVDIPTTTIASGSSASILNSSDLFSLGIINGSATGGCLYHYLSIFNRNVIVDAGEDSTLCDGDPIVNLVGSVEGGTTTGIWNVLNGSGAIASPTNLITTYAPTASDYAQGNLTFTLTSTGNCEPKTDTFKVDFISSPTSEAGLDQIFCKNNIGTINLSGSISFATGSNWTGGTGTFSNSGNTNTVYTPSPGDIGDDSVILYLSTAGSFFACPSAQDSVIIHFTDPPNVIAGADQVICSSESSVNLSGLVSGASNSGVWTTDGSGAFSPTDQDLNADYLLTPADTLAGNIKLILTSTNNGGCNAVKDSLEISILPKPVINITTEDSICSNLNTINLVGTVSPGFGSIWTSSGAGSIAVPGSQNTFYSISPIDTANGAMTVYLSTPGIICPVETDSLTIQFVTPPRAIAGLDNDYCSNEAIQLNGTISGNSPDGIWSSLGTGSFNPSSNLLSTIYQPSAGDVANGSVSLILTSTNNFGCPADEDTVTFTFLQSPIANFTFNDACNGNNTMFDDISTLQGGSIISWMWDFGDNTASIADDPQHPYPGSGQYDATLIVGGSNGCFDTLTQTINVNPTPVAYFDPVVICAGQPTSFDGITFISSGSIVSWVYDFGDGNQEFGNEDAVHTFDNVGNYNVTYTVTSDLGCETIYDSLIPALPGPDAAFTVSPNPALALEEVLFTDLSTGNNLQVWNWNFGDSIGDNTQNTSHEYANGGAYTITLYVEDEDGCYDTTSQEILVALLPVLPTAFTPNGDGENDTYIIRGGPFVGADFKIYNSWGELIFQTTDPLVGWDGNYNGQPAQLGVYSWYFEVEMPGGRIIRESGDVTLMR